MKGIVLHGGRGTRLRPLTHTGPKQLIPIAGKPMSQYALEDLANASVTEIAMILGDIAPEKVREYYGNGRNLGLEITYIEQGKPQGLAHAIGLAKEFVGEDEFVVYLGDNLLKGGILKYSEDFLKSKYAAMMLLTRVDEPQKFGVAEFDTQGRLVGLVEKPKYAPSPYAIVGVYFFRSAIFDLISKIKPSPRGELEITDALQLLFSSGRELGYRFVEGWWKDTGTVKDILEANRIILDEKFQERSVEGKVNPGVSIEGRVKVSPGAVLERDVVIRGPCFVGANSILGPNTYIGPYTSIGNSCKIEGVEIENSVVMDNCEIVNVTQRIADSIVGQRTSIKGRPSKPTSLGFILGEGSSITL